MSRINSNDFICKGHFTCHKECHCACENIFLMSSLALKGAFRKSEKKKNPSQQGYHGSGSENTNFNQAEKALGYRSGWTWEFERQGESKGRCFWAALWVLHDQIIFFMDCLYLYRLYLNESAMLLWLLSLLKDLNLKFSHSCLLWIYYMDFYFW